MNNVFTHIKWHYYVIPQREPSLWLLFIHILIHALSLEKITCILYQTQLIIIEQNVIQSMKCCSFEVLSYDAKKYINSKIPPFIMEKSAYKNGISIMLFLFFINSIFPEARAIAPSISECSYQIFLLSNNLARRRGFSWIVFRKKGFVCSLSQCKPIKSFHVSITLGIREVIPRNDSQFYDRVGS